MTVRDPVPLTRAAVNRLVADVGGPGMDTLMEHVPAHERGQRAAVGRSTVHELLTGPVGGPRKPRWETIAAVVRACESYHRAEAGRGAHQEMVAAGRFDLGQAGSLRVLFDRETGGGPPPTGPALPHLAELADQDLGVAPNRYSEAGAAPYVPRADLDDELDALLTDLAPPFPVLLIWGRTKSGKTRLAVEALRRNLPGHTRLVVPARPEDVAADLFDQMAGLADQPAVLWLDDPDVSQLAILDKGRIGQVRMVAVVIITVSARTRAALYDTTSRQAVGYMPVLKAARQLEVPFENTSEELRRASEVYPEEPIIGNIAETLSSAWMLLARYRSAEELDPAACAVVRAAVDLRRMGLRAEIDESLLAALAADHLADLAPNIALDDQRFRSAVAWATTPVASSAALLYRRRGLAAGHWLVFDHLVTADDGELEYRQRPVPDRLWSIAVAAASLDQAVSIGYTAQYRQNWPAAELAWRHASGSTDPLRSMLALNQLLATLTQSGSEEQADEVRDQLARLHPHFVVNKLYKEGRDRANSGDLVQARRRFEQVVATGLPLHRAMANLFLSIITLNEGDKNSAEKQFAAVMRRGIHEPAARAASILGDLAVNRGEFERARDLWLWATTWNPVSAQPEYGLVEYGLTNITMRTHTFTAYAEGGGPVASMTISVDSGLPSVWSGEISGELGEEITFNDVRWGAAESYLRLGRLSRDHDGDMAAAADYFERVLCFKEYPDLVSEAALALGLHREPTDPAAAAELFRTVIAAGQLQDSVTAAARLAVLDQIDPADVTAQLLQSAESENVLDAWVDQINSSMRQEQWRHADIGLRQALPLLPPDAGRRARMLREFGSAANSRGQTERGRAALREAADTGDAASMCLLAWSYHDDEPERFLEWIGRAADHGDTQAMYTLGYEAEQAGDVDKAIHWMRRAGDAGHMRATRVLARLYSDNGDVAESERYLAKAAGEGNPVAMRQLAKLLAQRGEDGPAQLWMLRAARRRLLTDADDHDVESAFPDADPGWSAPWEEAVDAWLSAASWQECEAALEAHPVLAGDVGILYIAERLLALPDDPEYNSLTMLQGILILGRDGDTQEGLRVAKDGDHAVNALLAALSADNIPTVVGVCNAGIETFESDGLLGPLTLLIVVITSVPPDKHSQLELEPMLQRLRSAALTVDPEWLTVVRNAVAGCVSEGDSWRMIQEALEPPTPKRRGLFRVRRRS